MKIFISWSGKHSLGVATALRDWLPYIFNGIELFVSSEDIRKGKRWPAEISKELDSCNFGIVCLTPDNLEAPWLLFEAGALSKSVKEASVYTLLLGGLRIGDIEGPLSHFQHTIFGKDDFFKLIASINQANESLKQDERRLKKIFGKFWDELDTTVARLLKSDSKPEKKRGSDEMLHEILEITNYIARNIPGLKERSLQPQQAPKNRNESQPDVWAKVVDAVGKISAFARSYLLEAKGEFSDGTLTITFPEEFGEHEPLVNVPRNIALLKKIMANLGLGENCSVTFKVTPSP